MEYHLDGFYEFEGKRKFFKAEFNLEKNNSLEGILCDYTANEKYIKGHLNRKEGLVNLSFLKMDQNSNYSNLLFKLEKFDSKSILGEYIGEWGVFPYSIRYDAETKLYLAGIDINQAKIKSKARITLY
jgi:hypothetical protein